MKQITKLKLDFRTKLFMTIVLSYTLLLGNLQQKYLTIAIAASLLPYLLLLHERRYKETIRGGIFILMAAIVQKHFLYEAKGMWTSLFLFIAILFLRMLPGFMMGKYALISTDMSELVGSLKKMKMPDQIVIPITVMARFFYTVREDYTQIKDAMYLHGLTLGKFITNPYKLFEYRIVPLLMCLTRTADEVAVSALTRGMEMNAPRSSNTISKMKIMDYIFFLLMIFLIGFYMRGKYA